MLAVINRQTKIIPRISQEPKLLGARVFDGQTKIALLSQGYLRVFNMADGKQLSATDERLLSSDNKFIINHRASLITEINNNGMLVFKDSTLNRRNLIQAHDGKINKAYYSVNDDLIYTAGSDNTIKIFRTYTGKLIGTLYIFKDSKDFVFIDPTGRFDGTPEGIKKLYYVKDRKVITLDKIYEKFYTPNLYQRLLNGEVFDPINIIIKGTPKVKIAYAEATRNLDVEEDTPTYQNKTGFAEIVVSAVTDDDAIDEIRLFHNGKIVTLTSRNLIVANNDGGSETKKYQLALLPGNNSIRAIALNTQRTESNADEIVVNYSTVANNNTPVVTKPVSNNGAVVSLINKDATLHLIVVGINEYQNKTMSLNYAIADATSFKEELEKDAKTILTNIKTYFVTNSTADKTGIINAFKQVQQNAKPQDVFVFYYAGHGVIGNNKEFYLVPTDVSDLKNVQGELEQKGIASKLLQQYAIDIQAQKQLFILDACQSAGVFEKLLSNDGDQQKSLAVVARSTGTHWMAASGAMQYANEFSSLGHGVFTYVLLQALKGEAANNKMITVNGLKTFLQVQVPLLMKKYNGAAQYPASYGVGNDFPVEIIIK
jgi:Caspase domain